MLGYFILIVVCTSSALASEFEKALFQSMKLRPPLIASIQADTLCSIIQELEMPDSTVERWASYHILGAIRTSSIEQLALDFSFVGMSDNTKPAVLYHGFGLGADDTLHYLWTKSEFGYRFSGDLPGRLIFLAHNCNEVADDLILYSRSGLAHGSFMTYYSQLKCEDMEFGYRVVKCYKVFATTVAPDIEVMAHAISVLSDSVALRTNPVVDNSVDLVYSYFDEKTSIGNVLRYYHMGDRGFVVGARNETDPEGWRFVCMKEHLDSDFLCGWISNAELMRIEGDE